MPRQKTLAVVLAALVGAVCGVSHATPPADGPKVFVGYVFGNTNGIDFKLYTHLCHAFITAGKDGKLNDNRRVPDKQLTADAHAAGVKVLLSLGGWGWDDQFKAMVADSAAEDRYVEAVLALIANNDYDGIDLDWEYPNTKDEVVGFERLSRRLRTGIDEIGVKRGQPMFLTMAASADPGTLQALDPKFLLDVYDWINVMTYDYAGEWSSDAGHNAPLFHTSKRKGGGPSIERTINFLLDQQKLPPQRIALGLPLYGRGFAVAEPYMPTKGARKARGGNYAQLSKLISDEGWTRVWDDETKTPWLKSPDGKQVIGYDDAESLTVKTKWAVDRGLRGVFFWEVRGDLMDDGSHPLQQAAHDALNAKAAN